MALSSTTGISTRRPSAPSRLATTTELAPCATRISARATLPRAASSVNTSAVRCPTKRGGGVRDATPGTD